MTTLVRIYTMNNPYPGARQADYFNNAIRRISITTSRSIGTPSSSVTLTASNTASSTSTHTSTPTSSSTMAAAASMLVNVSVTTLAGGSGGGFADGIGVLARFNTPEGVAVDPTGSFALIVRRIVNAWCMDQAPVVACHVSHASVC